MNREINILITSVGRRTKLLEFFKNELHGIGNLIATDCSNLAPALYKADKHYLVPKIDHPEYINHIKEICEKENIIAVLSLIDPELSLLSKHADELNELGVTSIVSSFKACEQWLDKYKAVDFFRNNGFKHAKTYNSITDFKAALEENVIQFPVFVKPQKGSASLNINKACNIEEAKLIFKSTNDMIIQEYLDGQELGVDVYVDLISKRIISMFIKEKISMRAGETDKARSIKSDALFKVIENLVVKSGLIGPIDIDVFSINGEYFISEINPRFGGGYLLAYECGVNFPKYIINNLMGIENKIEIGNYKENIFMMKHDSITINSNLI
jgi:carbamoyl-phosphate synthase large subunit